MNHWFTLLFKEAHVYFIAVVIAFLLRVIYLGAQNSNALFMENFCCHALLKNFLAWQCPMTDLEKYSTSATAVGVSWDWLNQTGVCQFCCLKTVELFKENLMAIQDLFSKVWSMVTVVCVIYGCSTVVVNNGTMTKQWEGSRDSREWGRAQVDCVIAWLSLQYDSTQ